MDTRAYMNSTPVTRLECFAAIHPSFSQSPNLPTRARAGLDGPACVSSSNSSSLDGDISSLSTLSNPRTPPILYVSLNLQIPASLPDEEFVDIE
jgi:hypothetical protein